jgi:hypothetical protein
VREEANGVPLYRLAMADDAMDLKTGACTIYIQCLRAVKAPWRLARPSPFRNLTRRRTVGWTERRSGQRRIRQPAVALHDDEPAQAPEQAVQWAGIAAHYAAKLTPWIWCRGRSATSSNCRR